MITIYLFYYFFTFFKMLNEIALTLMQIQDHERILKFVGIPMNELFLVFEYLPLGSLENYLEKNR